MTGLLVLWTGKRATGAWEEMVAEYQGRIRRLMPASEVRLRPAEGRDGDRSRVLAQEAAQVTAHLRPGDLLVALDAGGHQRSSEELARWLGEKRELSRLVFVLGSDLGLDPTLAARAQCRLSLSRLTLPHQLARLVLWEQLYRACDWLSGGSYHRA